MNRAIITSKPDVPTAQAQGARPNLFRWLIGIFLAVILEGAARKWLLPHFLDGPAFVAKDILALAFCWRHPIKRKSRFVLAGLVDVWQLVAMLLMVPFILGLLQNWQSAFISYKNAVLWPVFALHLAASLSYEDVRAFCRVLAGAATLMAGLALAQYRSPPDHWLNAYAWDNIGLKLGAATMGVSNSGVRATGTFSYVTGLTIFSIITFNLMIWLLTTANSRLERLWASIGLVMAICCGVTAGGRVAIAFFLLTSGLTALFAGNFLRVARVFAATAGAFIVLVFLIAPDASLSLYERATSGQDSVVDRITGEGLNANSLALMAAAPEGIGLGQFGGFANLQRGQTNGDFGMGYESRMSEAVYEGGVLGWLATMVTLLACISLVFQGLSSRWQPLRLSTATVGVGSLYAVSQCLWYDHNATAMHWLALGLWMALWPREKPRRTGPLLRTGTSRLRFAIRHDVVGEPCAK